MSASIHVLCKNIIAYNIKDEALGRELDSDPRILYLPSLGTKGHVSHSLAT
jgi:hypothetical protein